MIKAVSIFYFIFSLIFGQQNQLKNVKVLSYTKKSELVRYMKNVVSPELGVKCSFCHVSNDYASDKKDNKKVARKMMSMTFSINKTMNKLNFHEVSCWTCHKGNNHLDQLSVKK